MLSVSGVLPAAMVIHTGTRAWGATASWARGGVQGPHTSPPKGLGPGVTGEVVSRLPG